MPLAMPKQTPVLAPPLLVSVCDLEGCCLPVSAPPASPHRITLLPSLLALPRPSTPSLLFRSSLSLSLCLLLTPSSAGCSLFSQSHQHNWPYQVLSLPHLASIPWLSQSSLLPTIPSASPRQHSLYVCGIIRVAFEIVEILQEEGYIGPS